MSLKMLLFIAALSFIQPSQGSANSTNKSDIIKIQEQVLLELANEGVIDSYHVLAKFYENLSAPANQYLFKSIRWHVKAAQFGNANSLYRLGHLGLDHTKYNNAFNGIILQHPDKELIWQNEALIMISMAAILGNQYARTDLVMLPKMLPVKYQQIDTAVNAAVVRLEQGKPINCDFFICMNDDKSKTFSQKHLSSYKTATFEFNQLKERWKCQKLKRCLEQMLTNVSFIDADRIKRFYRETAVENRPKILKNQRLLREEKEQLSASWEQRSEVDRNQQRLNAAIKVINHHSNQDRLQLQTKITELLKKINFHRNPDNQIKLSDIMEILSQP